MTVTRLILRHLWIGLCALSMLAQTRLLLGMSLRLTLLDGFVFGSAVFAYGFTHPDRRVKTGAWLAGAVGGLCYLLALLKPAPPAWPMTVLIPLVLWLAYYGLRRPGNAGLRAVPVAKPFAVALAWGWVTVMLPLPPEAWPGATGVLTGRSAFIFALALAYDLADLDYDRRHGLKTWVGQLGARRTFGLAGVALALAILCSIANVAFGVYGIAMATGLSVSLLLSAWYLRHLTTGGGGQPYWRKWWIDALMPVQFLMLALIKILCFSAI